MWAYKSAMTTEGGKPWKLLHSWVQHDEDGSEDIKKSYGRQSTFIKNIAKQILKIVNIMININVVYNLINTNLSNRMESYLLLTSILQ